MCHNVKGLAAYALVSLQFVECAKYFSIYEHTCVCACMCTSQNIVLGPQQRKCVWNSLLGLDLNNVSNTDIKQKYTMKSTTINSLSNSFIHRPV